MTSVDDDETPAPDAADAGRAEGPEDGAKLLEEQRARIAALRFAVLSGRVPDEETFDYARFFGGPAGGDAGD